MTDAQFKRLQAKWYAAARADGFQDIESPSGMVPSVLSHGVSPARTKLLAQLEQDRAATERLTNMTAFERRVWGLHLEGFSNRAIASVLCVYRKLINETIWGLKARVSRGKPGPRRDDEAMRHDEVWLTVRMTRDVALAVDHLRTVLNVADVVRGHLLEVARKTPMRKAV